MQNIKDEWKKEIHRRDNGSHFTKKVPPYNPP